MLRTHCGQTVHCRHFFSCFWLLTFFQNGHSLVSLCLLLLFLFIIEFCIHLLLYFCFAVLAPGWLRLTSLCSPCPPGAIDFLGCNVSDKFLVGVWNSMWIWNWLTFTVAYLVFAVLDLVWLLCFDVYLVLEWVSVLVVVKHTCTTQLRVQSRGSEWVKR
jgi:hypothetical protein